MCVVKMAFVPTVKAVTFANVTLVTVTMETIKLNAQVRQSV